MGHYFASHGSKLIVKTSIDLFLVVVPASTSQLLLLGALTGSQAGSNRNVSNIEKEETHP